MNIMVYSKYSFISTQKLYACYVQTQVQNDKTKPQNWRSLAQLNGSKYFITSVSGIQQCQLAFISVFYI